MKSDLDKVLAAGTQAGAAPGAVAIVVNRNEVLWEGAAGERAAGSGTPMTTDTVGAIFSMTKAITGAAAMQLVEQGKIDRCMRYRCLTALTIKVNRYCVRQSLRSLFVTL